MSLREPLLGNQQQHVQQRPLSAQTPKTSSSSPRMMQHVRQPALSDSVTKVARQAARRRSLSGNTLDLDEMLTAITLTSTNATSTVTSVTKVARQAARRRSLSSSSLDEMLTDTSTSTNADSITVTSSSSEQDDRTRSRSPVKIFARMSARSPSRDRPSSKALLLRPALIKPMVISSNHGTSHENKNELVKSLHQFERSLSVFCLQQLNTSSSASPMLLQQKRVEAIMTRNSNVNDNIKKIMLQQLMLIFATIKKMEISEDLGDDDDGEDDDGQKSTATASSDYIIAVPSKETKKDVLKRLYQEQRKLVLSFGVKPDEIMVEALAVMNKLCTNTIMNVPQNLPHHNPFTTADFSKALSSWQHDKPSCAGYLVGQDMYISRQLFFLPAKKCKVDAGILPSFFKSTTTKKSKSIKWKTCRIVCKQKSLSIYDGNNTNEEILSGMSVPMLMIDMHRKLVLTPLKVYTDKYDEETFSLSIEETDEHRKTLKNDPKGQELIRFGFSYPEQYRFFHTLFAITLDSFHH